MTSDLSVWGNMHVNNAQASNNRPTSADVAIIGAGPAGLTAAYLLTQQGYSVTVIEKDPVYVGGISRTVERSEEHTSELQSLMRISYAVFCLKKKKKLE